ncbi:MAG: hypothetical protein K6B46_05675 [Opitutales bacterium]|nr:hypothetical protein [Opitutales bacterium]
MSNEKNNGGFFSTLLKIVIGVFLAILIFMAYLLCEQRGWIKTDLANILLSKVEDGKAEQEAKAKKEAEAKKRAASQDEIAAAIEQVKKEEEARRQQERAAAEAEKQKADAAAAEESTDSDDASPSADDQDSSDEAGDDSSSDDTDTDSDGADEAASDEPAPEAVPEKKKKITINYASIRHKKTTWPTSIKITKAGTKINILDNNGKKVGETTIPKNTKVFILDMTDSGLLTVRNANNKNQTFKIHASRTNFKKAYIAQMTEKPSLASSLSDSDSSSSDDSDDSGDSEEEGGDSSDASDEDDDFFDDDF